MIEGIYKEAIERAKKEKEWYVQKSRKKKYFSKVIRILSIIFVGLGTLCPLLESTRALDDIVDLSRWGYVSFAVAGILIGYDRFFGISSGWIRYTLAIQAIESSILNFKYNWIKRNINESFKDLSDEEKFALISMVQEFVSQIQTIVKEETLNWALDFENTLMELRKRTALNSTN